MPTVGARPTLRETQAVGVTLLHQFARERFREAGIRDDSLIREAETSEDLDDLASALLHDENLYDESNTTTTTVNLSNLQNETGNASLRSNGSNNSILLETAGDNNNGSLCNEERFHSMAESSQAADETRQEDRTMYHSINGDNHSEATSAFDRLQASPRLAAYGRELRRMADEFERSRLRQTVKESAESVNLFDITRKDFVDLLEVLFHGKITREKVVILFFFCTDAALYAVRELSKFGPEQMRQLVVKLLSWSFSYIINTFSSFIVKLGGWDKVLFYQFPSMLISCCAALAIFSLAVYLKKNLLRDAS